MLSDVEQTARLKELMKKFMDIPPDGAVPGDVATAFTYLAVLTARQLTADKRGFMEYISRIWDDDAANYARGPGGQPN